MDLKAFDGLIAEKFQAVAAFDQRQSLGDEALQLDRADLRAVLLLLAFALRLLIAVELAFDPASRPLRKAFERWLAPENFDAAGRQRVSLSSLTAPLIKARYPASAG